MHNSQAAGNPPACVVLKYRLYGSQLYGSQPRPRWAPDARWAGWWFGFAAPKS
jgi:hypothetical protein